MRKGGNSSLTGSGSVPRLLGDRHVPAAAECGCAVNNDEYASEPKIRDMRIGLSTLPVWFGCVLVRVYQATLSKMLPSNTCRFYPSCSHYAYQAIYKYGLIRGGTMGVWRVMRCNPFNPGGFDPVPQELPAKREL